MVNELDVSFLLGKTFSKVINFDHGRLLLVESEYIYAYSIGYYETRETAYPTIESPDGSENLINCEITEAALSFENTTSDIGRYINKCTLKLTTSKGQTVFNWVVNTVNNLLVEPVIEYKRFLEI